MASGRVTPVPMNGGTGLARHARSLPGLLLLCGLLPGAGGCATARLAQFHDFAQAGTAYVKASQVMLDEAGSAAIDADSLVAQAAREALPTPDKRRKYIRDENQALRERLAVLRQIALHGALLQSYFETLAAMADPKASATLGAAAQGLFDSIGALSPKIKNASVGGVSVASHIPQATTFVVQALQARALEKELKAHAQGIEREIALQEAALKIVAASLATDLTVRLQRDEIDQVIEPFATSDHLASGWARHRLEVLQARDAAESAEAASEAARRLRESFVALVENRPTAPSIASLMASVNGISALTQKTQNADGSK